MIRTLDFNGFAAGTIIDDEYAETDGVTVSAVGGSNLAMLFDSNNPTGDDTDLASDTLDGLLIISGDGDSSDPDDFDGGGSIFFDFDTLSTIKSITFKDIEETTGEGTRLIFYDANGDVIDNQFVEPTEDGGERTVQLFVPGTARLEVRLEGSGAVDNLVFDDGLPADTSPTAVDDTGETTVDTPVIVDLLSNDTDPDNTPDELSIAAVSVPPEQGSVVDNGDGTVTFTPAPGFTGDATITYTVADPDGQTDEGLAVVAVDPAAGGNTAPDAVDDADTTAFNTPITVDLLANDTDAETPGLLTVISATVPADQGTLVNNGDGTVTFTPAVGFIGDATISYTIDDPEGLTDSAIHTVTVTGTTPPGMLNGIVEGTPGADLIDTAYDGDPQGDRVDSEDAILPGQAPNDDIIFAGDGDDTVLAGLGDDLVYGGEGNDSIIGGPGSDTVYGGPGDDFIDTSGPDLAPDLGYPFAPELDPLGFAPDADPENDRDLVFGGDGNDTIRTGDDRDTIFGGDGDDVIDGGIDDDLIDGGAGNDRIVGGEGNDTIFGGDGDDTIYAGNDPELGLDFLDIPDEATPGFPFSPDRNPDNGRDVVDGGAGNDLIFGADDADLLVGGTGDDTIYGELDNDTIDGGEGNDSLFGGQGDDSIDGGAGNDLLEGGDGDDFLSGGDGDDTMSGGAGNDTMIGGGGQDLFLNVTAGDVIDGGSGPIDFDTLDLRGSAPEGGRLEIVYTSDDREDGIVNYFDVDGNDAGQLVFEEIENVIPCFTPGTKIATPKGERLVEELQVGDRVITRDNGIREIRWVGARDMSGAEFEKAAHLKPVLIRQGALGNDLPERDMMVSPNHRVLVANDKTALYFEEREVLVAAKHLTGLEGVDIVEVSHTTYIHIMFDNHEVILSDGAWTESFQPGDMSMAGIGNAQRQEILELFPELATRDGIDRYASARRSLKKHEAQLITR